MAGGDREAPWSVDDSTIPAPFDQHATTYFGFIPSEARHPADGNDPLGRSVVRLLAFRVGEGTPRKAGTAVAIASDVLITAAHNVFDPTNSGFGTQRQGYAQAVQISSEFMAVPAAVTTRFVAPPGYTRNGDRGADLAVIKLNAAVPTASSLVMQALPDQEIQQKPIVIYGYPELAPQLFYGRGRCVAARPGALFHTADAAEGESGGPFFIAEGGSLALVGLHRAGPAESPGDVPPSCGAVRLSAGAIAWISEMEQKL